MKIFKKISKRTKTWILAFTLAIGGGMMLQPLQPIAIHAETPDDNSNPGELPPGWMQDPDEKYQSTTGLDYNEDGILERMVVGLYDVQLTIFGVDINFNNLGGSLEDFLDFEKMKTTTTGGAVKVNLYDFFKGTVYPLASGLGISLLTMMMMWKFIKECLEVERFSWEKAMMLVVRTIIVNMFIVNSFMILEFFFEAAMDIFDNITTGESAGAMVRNIGEVFAAGITKESNFVFKCIIAIFGMIGAFVYYTTCIAVISQVLVRYIKIMVGMAFAPIPIALSMDEQHGTDVMRYIFWMMGCFLQAPIMKVCFYIYGLMLSEVSWQISAASSQFDIGTMIPVCLLLSLVTGMLVMMLNMAQQITDRIMPA